MIALFPASLVGFRPEELERRTYRVRDSVRREIVPKPEAAFASYLRILHRFPRQPIQDYRKYSTTGQDLCRPDESTRRRFGQDTLNGLIQGLLDSDAYNVPTPTGLYAEEEAHTFFDQRAFMVSEEWRWREGEEWMRQVVIDLLMGRCTVDMIVGRPPPTPRA